MNSTRFAVICYAVNRPVAPTTEAAGLTLADAINFVESRLSRETTTFSRWQDNFGALVREGSTYGYRIESEAL